MAMYPVGIVGVIVFYAATLMLGIWAGAQKKKKADDLVLANRSIGLFLGVFTLIATWVGGAFVNGTAEIMFTKGMLWCQVPISYSLSLLFGAILFVKPMRKAQYVTMLDPFQEKYGSAVGGLLFLPALCGDLFWCGSVLKALGSSLSVMADLDPNVSVCASALLAGIYTVFGGLYSVACTDALQLASIGIGLAIAAPFAMQHQAVTLKKTFQSTEWIGEIKNEEFGIWIDGMLLLIFGGIPWQGYFQRILSIRTTKIATLLSCISVFGCLLLAIPSALIGVVARSTDWSAVAGFNKNMTNDEANASLPLVLRYLTPEWVSFVGLGAISAAVMSSADSSMLASSSMFSRNIYRLSIRPKASDRELDWILRIAIIVVASLSTAIALTVGSVYYLSYMASDLVFVVLFPQLLAVVHWPSLVDTYGCLAGYTVAATLRIAGGENGLGLPALIEYPFFDAETQTQRFPFRTAAMLTALLTQLFVSFLTRNLLGKGCLPECFDVLGVYSRTTGKSNEQSAVTQSNSGAPLMDSSSVNKSSSGLDSIDSIGLSNFTEDGATRIESNDTQTIPTIRNSVQPSSTNAVRNKYQTRPLPKPNATLRYSSSHEIDNTNQILGVRNLPGCYPHHPNDRVLVPTSGIDLATHTNMSAQIVPIAPAPVTKPIEKIQNSSEKMGIGDRTKLDFKLHSQEHVNVGPKKNVKGVKLIGMDGTATLRRPSLQGTFSPTPSVEFVHILDRRQSSGSFGPGSLSPVPMGLEACKTHGTALEGQTGNEHCKIKRGIVRHHSFNETGDRTLTTLARQPTYPSMPLRTEDCRMSLIRREKKTTSPMVRHSSVLNEKELVGCRGLVSSPTYSMYNSGVRNSNYFVADDEAISRF